MSKGPPRKPALEKRKLSLFPNLGPISNILLVVIAGISVATLNVLMRV